MIVYTNKHKIPFQIDEDDYEIVSRYSWHLEHGYPATNIRCYYNGLWISSRTLRLHQFLLGKAPEGLEWDHIDQDKLNNQRKNCRAVTRQINSRNTNPFDNIFGYRGIQYNFYSYVVSITTIVNEKIYLGSYLILEDAIAARKAAEILYWGDTK